MSSIRCLQIDAFTDRPFAGNPAAVCLLERDYPAPWMQAVAAEMNLSETAFVRRLDSGYALRWFTPQIEVELCGHATLASAHALWSTGEADPNEPVAFHTLSGVLTCRRNASAIELDFPAMPVTAAQAPAELLAALNLTPSFVGQSKFDKFMLVGSEQEVRGAQPDFALLKKVAMRGVILTSRSENPRFDFISRYFAPAAGIDEDPVTGSAHCSLGPFWSERLGKTAMTAFQASARGGIVSVRIEGERVVLGGHAVTIFSGTLADSL